MKTKLPNQTMSLNPFVSTGWIDGIERHLNRQVFKKPKLFSNKKIQDLIVEGQGGERTIGEICGREGITPSQFYEWSYEFINSKKSIGNIVNSRDVKYYAEDEKHRIVLDGLSGSISVAELCRKEQISQKQFLKWSSEFLQIRHKRFQRELERDNQTAAQKEIILHLAGSEVLKYFESYLDVTSDQVSVFSNADALNRAGEITNLSNILCLCKVNNLRFINKHFEKINQSLPYGGMYMGFFETFTARKERMKINKLPLFNNLYFGLEFLLKRIIPKVNLTQKLYFNITEGKDRLLSKAEVLGRLVSCGFQIVDFKAINGLVYFVVKKIKEPDYNLNPSYGPLYKMPRLGKGGKIIGVYKLRTMHPYSEYLQDYILRAHGYAETGKPADDFRIPKWGKVMRRFWLDEIPQLINVFKGEMKLVGIRPVSLRYFQDIPKEMQRLRLTQKPGCIPPYVALNRDGNVMSVLQAEREYLEEKIKNPYTTDIKYFYRAIFNIVFRHKRSA